MARLWAFLPDQLWLRRSLQALIIVFVILLVVFGIIRVLAKTSLAHGFVETRIEALTLSGQSIEIEGLCGDLLGGFSVDTIRVQDTDGVWLDVRHVELDWSPLLLLGGTLNLKDIEAGALTVSRRPEILSSTDASEDQSQGGWLRRYRLQALEIPSIDIAEPVFGEAIAAGLLASVDTTLATGHLELTLTPDAAEDDRVDGTLTWGGTVPLVGRMEAAGPENGLIASLLGAQANGPVDIVIEANGDRRDWQADGYINLDQVRYVTLVADGSDQDLSAHLDADLSAFAIASPLQARLGPEVSASFQADPSEPARLTVEAIDTQLEARAPFDWHRLRPNLETIDINLVSLSPQLIGVEGLTYDRLSIDGAVSLIDTRIGFDGRMRSDALTYAGAESQIATYIGDVFETDLDATLDFSTNQIELHSARLSPRLGEIQLSGLTGLSASEFTLEGEITLNPAVELLPEDVVVSPLVWTVQRAAGGAVEIRTRGDIELGGGMRTAWTQDPLAVESDLLIDPAGRVEARAISVRGSNLDAVASGEFDAGQLTLNLTSTAGPGEIETVAIGGLDLDANLAGPMQGLAIDVSIKPTGLVINDYALDEPAVSFQGRRAGNQLQGDLAVRALHEDEPLSLDAVISQSADMWGLNELQADLLGIAVQGSASGRGASIADLTADFQVNGASPLMPQVGQIDGQIRLTGETVLTDLTFDQVSAPGLALDSLRLTGEGTRAEILGDLQFQGQATLGGQQVRLETASTYALRPPRGELQFNLDAALDGARVQSTEPITLRQVDGQTMLSADLSMFDGVMTLDGARTPDGLDLDAQIQGVSVTELAALVGRDRLVGQIDGAISLTGADQDLTGQASFDFTRLSQQDSDFADSDLSTSVTLTQDQVLFSAILENDRDEIELTSRGEIPVTASAAPLGFALRRDAPTEVQLDGRGSVEALWSLLGPIDTRFEGDFVLNASAAGPLDQLRPQGQVQLIDGVFEDGVLGLRLKEIAAEAVVNTDGVQVNALSAAGTKGGRVTGSGVYAFDGDGDVDLVLDGLNALQRSDVTATLSGDLSVRRQDRKAQVTGDLIFDRVEVNMDQLPRGGFTTLDVRWPARGVPPAEPVQEALPIDLNVGLRGNRRIFVTGQSITSEWGIDAQLTGTARAPNIVGTARVIRGQVDLVGQPFELVDSTIRFNGDPSEADLSMRAERDADDLLAFINVTGTPLAPEFSLGSDPALPEDEVLSRVLFGVSPSQLSAFQAAQLAAAVASLAGGGGGGLDLVGSLENALDVDRLDLGVAEDGATSLGAGKYVAEDVYVELNTGTRGAPGFGVEWTPRRNVEIGAELGSEAAPRFTVQWKRDFDFRRDEAPDDEAEGQGAEQQSAD
ncbi:MAG: translocation/assembly module TamB domain-containing protein [Henriciella sp.]|nr:translocation/assembly module TamB domain-containing protein [Henriciella sp.]